MAKLCGRCQQDHSNDNHSWHAMIIGLCDDLQCEKCRAYTADRQRDVIQSEVNRLALYSRELEYQIECHKKYQVTQEAETSRLRGELAEERSHNSKLLEIVHLKEEPG